MAGWLAFPFVPHAHVTPRPRVAAAACHMRTLPAAAPMCVRVNAKAKYCGQLISMVRRIYRSLTTTTTTTAKSTAARTLYRHSNKCMRCHMGHAQLRKLATNARNVVEWNFTANNNYKNTPAKKKQKQKKFKQIELAKENCCHFGENALFASHIQHLFALHSEFIVACCYCCCHFIAITVVTYLCWYVHPLGSARH